jgi:hypothetical protein
MITLFAANVIAAGMLGSCERQASPPPAQGPAAHVEDEHGHGDEIALGKQAIGGFEVGVSLMGAAVAGKEAHVEITVEGGAGKPGGVRVWIGTADAKGSLKARADAEEHGYHAHVETPDPLPAGSKLWVEIEDAKGQAHTGSFDLKTGP